MALANELFDAAELTGIARAELENMEEQETSASLAVFLPNEYVSSHVATYHAHEVNDSDTARYRAFDAAPERGRGVGGGEKSVRLPAVSQTQSIGEETKLNLRSRSDDAVRNEILRATRQALRSVYNRVNIQRASVLETGRAVVNQDNYKLNDDFGRHPDLTTSAPALWTDTSASRTTHLLNFMELYTQHSGEDPGAIVMGRRVLSSLVQGTEFGVELASGTRPGNQAEVFAFLEAAGLPPIYVFNKRVDGKPLISDDRLLMLPAPVGADQPDATELGSTVWGLTATALADGFEIEDAELPGIVAGVEAPTRVPYIHEVFADSVNLPILKSPNLSLSAKVL